MHSVIPFHTSQVQKIINRPDFFVSTKMLLLGVVTALRNIMSVISLPVNVNKVDL